MPAELRDLRALEDVHPCGLKSGRDIEHTWSTGRLLAPAFEHTHCLSIQRQVTRLTSLRVRPFNRQQLMVEVDGPPSQLQKFAAAKPGVHGEEDGRRQVIPEMR